jgi:hypothetical protein
MRLPILILIIHNCMTMNWYFNNDGAADGPHDESAMLAFIQAGRVSTSTLIWHGGLDLWQEAGTLQTKWWQPLEAPAATVRKPEASTGTLHRSPLPIAPTEKPTAGKGVSLLKRWFGRKEKS